MAFLPKQIHLHPHDLPFCFNIQMVLKRPIPFHYLFCQSDEEIDFVYKQKRSKLIKAYIWEWTNF